MRQALRCRDIIDVKKHQRARWAPTILGDSRDQILCKKAVSAAIATLISSPEEQHSPVRCCLCGADYIKIGLTFEGKEKARVISAVVKAVKDDFPDKYVVIAAYSDYERMKSISPFDMAPIAADEGLTLSWSIPASRTGRARLRS